MTSTVFGAVAAIAIAVAVLQLVVRRRLLLKYAALWLGVGVVLVVVAVIPGFLAWVSELFGFAVPANFLFTVGASLLLLIALQLSVELSRVEQRLQRLVEELAILRERVEHDEGAAQ
ncbi:DUF2304 domain-containing protein [Mumia zhuanghuii]|uniref:DUF2304 domain-containing protein n=1 Tax=Mumia zhuanghuii TaxID=2585211 RepID=UPI00363EE428